VCGRARGPCLRDEHDPDVLLRASRTAVRADTRSDAAAHVAKQVAARETERLDAAANQRGIRARDLSRNLAYVQLPFDAAKEGLERVRVQLLQSELAAPALEHAGRRAKAGRRVDDRRPSHSEAQ